MVEPFDARNVAATAPSLRVNITIRRLHAGDAPLPAGLLSQLSERTRRLRYMAVMPRGPEAIDREVARLLAPRLERSITLGAATQVTGRPALVGVAELVCTSQHGDAGEIAGSDFG